MDSTSTIQRNETENKEMEDLDTSEIQSTGTAVRALCRELMKLKKDKLEGFCVKLFREDDLFDWDVGIYGPPNTVYHGAYLKASMRFPYNYPMQPPDFYFRTAMFHPNVYANGMIYMSILYDGCWNPTMSARTVLLSVVSLLTGPDTDWPCNQDAADLYIKWRDSQGEDKTYEDLVALQKANWKEMARLDGVVVPETVEEYCCTAAIKDPLVAENFLMNELCDLSDLSDLSDLCSASEGH
ncbi:ubiquitin-conjugating enzyme E2 R2-like [Drosophila obscura]|uniref:ubiquitin-conjugating enzyme E2 R2-like n=1 Tax=Drosophila obscura TaxID=7282 RepID=UPI001BB10AAE|nr:ubiquitin-conjugating enzyme E2 R2-like [Drosophila obscura]